MTPHDADVPTSERAAELDAATREALGSLSEALETVERARGHLYAFHQLCGTADFALGRAVTQLAAAGHTELAQRLETELLGRNVLDGRWSYQVVEEYDDTYWSPFHALERTVRDELADGQRHVYEAALKESRRSHGHRHHEAAPTRHT